MYIRNTEAVKLHNSCIPASRTSIFNSSDHRKHSSHPDVKVFAVARLYMKPVQDVGGLTDLGPSL